MPKSFTVRNVEWKWDAANKIYKTDIGNYDAWIFIRPKKPSAYEWSSSVMIGNLYVTDMDVETFAATIFDRVWQRASNVCEAFKADAGIIRGVDYT